MTSINKPVISESELTQRVAVLSRFRELLIQQRDRFRSYLAVLDKQQSIISTGSAETVLAYVELEESIAADIFSIQKVIEPLELMYHQVVTDPPVEEISTLKSTLENLKKQTAIQSKHNRELISARMESIRNEINELKNNPFNKSNSIYRADTHTASLIDIRG